MSKLQDYQAEQLETIKKIYEWHEEKEANKPLRLGRLGASVIGKPCERELWYSFRKLFTTKFDGRMLRLFATGHLEEPRFVQELRGIGCTVYDIDQETGRQFELTDFGGHFVCYPDAAILGLPEAPKTWHVAEFKTMNDKGFNKLKKEGVKKSKPEHYAQMMVGMGMSGMTRALYLVKNKDTDELYGERVKFDAVEYSRLRDKAQRVITSTNPPDRIADRPDDFRCRFCDAYDLCWNTGVGAVGICSKTCRSCCHATAELDGEGARWSCARLNVDLCVKAQSIACDFHLLLPGLVSFADPTDSGPDWIEFTNKKDGAVWRHGNGDGMWSTGELMTSPSEVVGQPVVQKIKDAFSGTAVAYGKKLTLIEKYPPDECELLWEGPEGELEKAAKDIVLGEKPSGRYEDEKCIAWEFMDNVLTVIYKGEDYSAIWKGKE